MVTTSSVEVEYIASASATKKAVWLCTLLEELDFPQITAIIINIDNQDYIILTHNPIGHSCTKYIDIWHRFIQEYIE